VLDRKINSSLLLAKIIAKAKGPTAQLFELEGLETNRTRRTHIEIFSENYLSNWPDAINQYRIL
jgi:hypothetical protein